MLRARRNTVAIALMIAVATAGVGAAYWKVSAGGPPVFNDRPAKGVEYPFTVRRVLDPATFQLHDGTTVRLTGIAGPQSDDPWFQETLRACGDIVLKRHVRFETDRALQDETGTRLVYAFVRLDDEHEVFVNGKLVELGGAFVSGGFRNTRYFPALVRTQGEARANRVGLWKWIQPRDSAVVASLETCFFHLPGCPLATDSDSDKWRRIASKNDAFDQGFAPCSRCKP